MDIIELLNKAVAEEELGARVNILEEARNVANDLIAETSLLNKEMEELRTQHIALERDHKELFLRVGETNRNTSTEETHSEPVSVEPDNVASYFE